MQLQLSKSEIGEFAKLKSKFFGPGKFLLITPELESDVDYHRYIILNGKVLRMMRFFHRLKNAPLPVYVRVQKFVARHTSGGVITGSHPSIGLIIE